MTEYDFTKQMERIKNTFGKNFYSEERLARIWQHCAELPTKSFERIVNGFLDTARYAPTPNDFREQKVEEMRKLESHAARNDGAVLTKLTATDKERVAQMLKREGVISFSELFEKRRRERKQTGDT